MTFADYAGLVVAATPWWAYAVLVLLVVLGVRRLKSRARRPLLAFLAPSAFFVWGLFNLASYAQAHSAVVGGAALLGCLGLGWASARAFSSERIEPLDDGRFLFHGTPEPLATYIVVFATRFGLEVWAGFVPSADAVAGGMAIGISALVAGRTAQRAFWMLGARRRFAAAAASSQEA